MSLKRIALGCVAVMVATNLAILATGNMHAHRHHPLWVTIASWIFAVAAYALAALAIVAITRWRRRRFE